jgi:indole-3-glycerol phosphate synthase
MNGFLDRAFAAAQARVERWRREKAVERFHNRARRNPSGSFALRMRQGEVLALIAEIKRASPSAGPLASEVDVSERARLYFNAGAAAVSILTEPRWFRGSLEDLAAARATMTGLLLRKDFIVDEYDLEVSAAAGADAVLLIAACFSATRLRELLGCAKQLDVEVLLETHDESDATKAMEAGAEIIGVNSRDLQTLSVDFDRALRVLRQIPKDRVRILESGIRSAPDAAKAAEAGANAILVGEALMRAHDPAGVIRSLLVPVAMDGLLKMAQDR